MTAEIIFLPKPKSICYGEGVFEMCYDTYIVCGEDVETLPARLLGQDALQWAGGLRSGNRESGQSRKEIFSWRSAWKTGLWRIRHCGGQQAGKGICII